MKLYRLKRKDWYWLCIVWLLLFLLSTVLAFSEIKNKPFNFLFVGFISFIPHIVFIAYVINTFRFIVDKEDKGRK